MARQTIVGHVLRLVAVHAEAHVVIHDPLGNRLVPEVAVTRRARHARPDVRRVVEAHVRLAREAVHALPRNLDAFVGVLGHLLDQRLVERYLAVADHAGLDAGDPRDRALLDALVAVDALRLLRDVRLVREWNRLLGLRPDAEVIARGLSRCSMRRGEYRRGDLRRLRAARDRTERDRCRTGPGV